MNFTIVGGKIQQPVNDTRNGQLPSMFKYGSTIPVKVEITNCNGGHPDLGRARPWSKTAGSVPASADLEATSTNAPDAENAMRFCIYTYIFNLSTKAMTNDATATFTLTVKIQSTGQAAHDRGLKK